MALTLIPVGGYSNVTQVVSAAAQTAILAEVDKFLAVLPNPDAAPPTQGATPDYDDIRPEILANIRAEISALKAAIDAAPTA